MLRGIGMNNTDFSLIKNTTIHDSLGFQLRFEFFNAFNESDLGPFPGLSLTAPPSPWANTLLYRTGVELFRSPSRLTFEKIAPCTPAGGLHNRRQWS